MIAESSKFSQIGLTKYRHTEGYWERRYTCIAEEAIIWQKEIKELRDAVCQCDIVIIQHIKASKDRETTIAELSGQIEALKAEIINLKKQIFGRKTEQSAEKLLNESANIPAALDPEVDFPEEKRNRGKQKGAKGYGRKIRTNLPCIEEYHELPKEGCHCPICTKPYIILPDTEDSEEIVWKVNVYRKRHKRVKYIPSCNCGAVKGIVTAPSPAKLIPKGMFDISFWINVILGKYLFQMPLYRIRHNLSLEGLQVSSGTLIGGLKTIGELLQPLYAKILEHGRLARCWKMDETRWMVYEEIEGKKGHNWWLWVMITADTVVYIIDPTRSSKVPKNYLGENPKGTINADRLSTYKALGEHISIAFCWSHVRRDFIEIGNGYRTLSGWADKWVKRINDIFHQNDKRLLVLGFPEDFEREDKILRNSLNEMVIIRDREINSNTTHNAAKKALCSLRKHWKGCILFVDNPHIPMDNNESERMLRNPVIGRKNYYGSGSVWSGTLTAILFTIIQTLIKNNIDPKKWLFSYFKACAQNNGCTPENIDTYLPWNFTQEQKLAYCKGYSP